MSPRILLISLVTAVFVALAGPGLAREPAGQNAVTAEQLIAEALAGEEGKEVNVQIYTFAPGAVLPWHIHPDAHEVAYVLEGEFTFERAGEQPRKLKPGEADYLPPNIVHRGLNEGDTAVKLFVVRIKPKDKPLVEEVPPPQ
jgi:quercetin dioxygenase-like cupin family protein